MIRLQRKPPAGSPGVRHLVLALALAWVAWPARAGVPVMHAMFDGFDQDTVANGSWDLATSGSAGYSISGGHLRMTTSGEGSFVLVSRPAILAASGGAFEARVKATALDRYGLFFIAGEPKAGIEFDSEGFCACRSTAAGWRVDRIPGLFPAPGEYYRVRAELDPAGALTIAASSDDGQLLGELTVTDVAFTSRQVLRIGVQVWGTSDYSTDWVRLVPLGDIFDDFDLDTIADGTWQLQTLGSASYEITGGQLGLTSSVSGLLQSSHEVGGGRGKLT